MTAPSSHRGSTGGKRPGAPDIPESIGRYRISRLLGRGGQGDVYLARHPSLDIDVAVKVLHPEYRREEFIERFSNEARIAAKLDVRNIVRVYDFDPEHPYLVMEYCGDGDLSRYIKSRRRRPLPEMISIVRQVLEALVAAHENRPPILHRDLKPSNVLFSKGIPKVADYGLAKALGGGSGLTTTRGMMGTIRYCSPEQMKDASAADSRTDLWSVGIMLFEMLAWRRPFDKPGDSDSNVMFKVFMEQPQSPPYEIPAPLMAVIHRALEKERDKRFASAREMIAAMDEAMRRIPGASGMLLPPETLVDELSRMASEISTLLDQGQSEAAESVLKSLRKKAPDDSVGRFWRDRLKELRDLESRSKTGSSAPTAERRETSWIKERLSAVESHINRRDYREARRMIGEILYKAPDNTDAHHWLERITEEERRLREDLDKARREAEAARTAHDYSRVAGIWKEIDARYPGMAEVQSEVAVATREKLVHEQSISRQQTAQQVRRLQGEGNLKGALAAWAAHLARYPDDEEALQHHEELTAAATAQEKAERLAGMKAAAMQRRQAGDLQGALALWEGYLIEDPGWEEAAREVGDLRQLISRKERAARLEQTRARAAAHRNAGDPGGALAAWETLARVHPDETEAQEQIGSLRAEIASREREAIAAEIECLASELKSRADSGRYRSVSGAVPAAVAKAMEAARAARSADASTLARARESLVSARRDAEATLASDLTKWRLEVQRSLALNRDWIPRDGAASATPEEKRLGAALERAMATLCASHAPTAPGDPLEALIGAHHELTESAGALASVRQKMIDAARTAAAKSLQEAEGSLEALLEIGAEAPGRGIDPRALRDRLGTLREETTSKIPGRLSSVARQADALTVEARAGRLLAIQELVRELADLVREGRAHLVYVQDERLEKLVREAARWAEPDGPGEPIEPKALSALRQELRSGLDTTRRALNERIAKAEERWRKAEKAWRELLTANLGPAPREKAERVITGGQMALTALRAEELESWAGQLDGLIRRCRLESIWIEQSDAVLEIEGPLGPDGLPAGDLAPERQELLARYRTAAARGSAEQVRALAAAIEKTRARSGQKEAQGPAGPETKIPDLTPGARKLNARYNAAALKSYDDLRAKHRSAVSGRRSGEAARVAAELARAHRRLVQPAPLWRRLLIPGGALVVVAAGVVVAIGPGVAKTARHEVRVVSPAGAVTVESLTRDGARMMDVETRIDEDGATWSLEPGHYTVTVEGVRKEFDVPGPSGLLLPGGARNYLPALQESLDMKSGSGP